MQVSPGPHIALIGFGEAGQAFATGWGPAVAGRVAAFDIRPRAALTRAAADLCVPLHASSAAATAQAQVVLCLVTADQAIAAARAAAPDLPPGALWLDGNSCSPGAKRAAAAVIDAAGGRYVDMAIMSPVHPRLHRSPALLSGPHAEAALDLLAPFDMTLRVVEGGVGAASSIKMLRSVMIKGFEALTAESLLAARRAGVEGEVLASLQASDPGWDWPARTAYNLDRMMMHGQRRAAEMREVAATLRELGLPHDMASATVLWQDRIGALGLDPGPADLASRADRILDRLE
ncbi:NAD(P)-dependent oxidoreductase [Neotabrizicola shimadae]|uniref:DUF1932 domain-containing protein n=1 Tax=Neotabrizicola shimadae TaxID=2807096 RepID=A0A8G1EDM9_9RHOB|nr:NAD(P)-dependent oxidoreductase [Neotabrizicola shimadae]QYZ69599.1 DUF1932 domain-containing protein [Neotabrizicola shimadae]